MKSLFILKKNETYGFKTKTRRSSGLYNSTRFISESLKDSHIIEVDDNNCIDKWVQKFKPDVVVIEALWVVPEKFDVLKKLHPKVKWYVHMHSGLPFLACEGIATEWLHGYAQRGIGIIANSVETFNAFKAILPRANIVYLPNVYVPVKMPTSRLLDMCETGSIAVGCFGAIRPMKNHLHQAIAAIKFASKKRKHLFFYINSSRIELNGDPCLKNLIKLFENRMHATLVFCDWMEPEEFLTFLNKYVDIGLQVSMTETFNVVCADYVTAGIPFVNSKAITWTSSWNRSKDECIDDTVRVMERVYRNKFLVKWNRYLLNCNSKKAISMWSHFMRTKINKGECK